MENIDISRYLIKKYGKICTSDDLKERFGNRYMYYIAKLTNTWWIRPLPVFRGVYYILDPEEKQMRLYHLSKFQILIKALNKVMKNNWYFTRATALHLLGAINQPVSKYYIANPKVSKRVVSKFFGELIFVKTDGKIGTRYGVSTVKYKDSRYYVSNAERTIADYLYLYVHGHIVKKVLLDLRASVKYNTVELKHIIGESYPSLSSIKMRSLVK
jgi:hypothetical protein